MNYEGTIHPLLAERTMVDHTPKAKFDLPAFHGEGQVLPPSYPLRGLKSYAKGTSKMADVKVGYSA